LLPLGFRASHPVEGFKTDAVCVKPASAKTVTFPEDWKFEFSSQGLSHLKNICRLLLNKDGLLETKTATVTIKEA
jgi:hypothetical protein